MIAWLHRVCRVSSCVRPLGSALHVVCLVAVVAVLAGCSKKTSTRQTTSEVEVVHPQVTVREREARGVVRLAPGDAVATGPDGRARVRMDDGTRVTVDRSTRLVVTERGLSVAAGRIFVIGGEAARTEIEAASAVTIASAGSMAVSRTGDTATLHAVDGEVVTRVGAKQQAVKSGETATVNGQSVAVAPEKAFVDWTGGLASRSSATAPRCAIGELYGVSDDPEDPGTPLAIRSHEVDVRLQGEVASTRVSTTYFNGGASTSRGDFRIALPEGALVSRFAVRSGGQVEEGVILGLVESNESNSRAALTWAGSGWARGHVAIVPAGETLTVVLEYVEWLSPARGVLSYRYPMATDGPAPVLGELRARVDLGDLRPKRVSFGAGATLSGTVVELKKADYRPTADLVVEAFEPEGFAAKTVRTYVVQAREGDRSRDAYVLARADLPDLETTPGISLSIVVDTSHSVSPAELDTSRAVVDALLEGLGPKDKVAVFATDQGVRSLGGEGALPVDAARRAAIRTALTRERPGGATDLGAALERAAAGLPEDATAAMVVYVGDGWPTVGDTSVEAIRKRLSRRTRGIPRIGAFVVGPAANHYGLVALARGSAPVIAVRDRADAASAAVSLVAQALEPAVEAAVIDLGDAVDRLYPRAPVAQPFGSTLSIVGRIRGVLPKTALVRYRSAGRPVSEERTVANVPVAEPDDVRRRWAAARVEELALEGTGLETVIDLALRSSLLTPWTAFTVGGTGATVLAPPAAQRLLELSSAADVPFASRLAPRPERLGAVLESPVALGDVDVGFEDAVRAAARRTIDEAAAGVRKCRDLRAALRPEITGALDVRVAVDGGGRATTVTVRSTEAVHDDAPLNRCIEVLLSSLVFFDSGLARVIDLQHVLRLPPPRDPKKTRCSRASKLPLLVRRGVWRARLARGVDRDVILRARQGCEIKTAVEHRALVDLVLEALPDGIARVELARSLEEASEVEAAALVRRAAVRDAASPEELERIRVALVVSEPFAIAEFEKQYRAAATDEARLAVVRRFLRLAPHAEHLRRRLLALLEVMGDQGELANVVHHLRTDPFADAALLADGAAALRRVGQPDEGLRAFGEIVERAPRDPYARALVGDRLRDEGLFDDAVAAYAALEALLPADPAVSTRIALAHAGAGRLDVASRLFTRVVESPGRGADADLGALASVVTSVLMAEARKTAGAETAALERRALEVPLPDVQGVLLVRTPSSTRPVSVRVARGTGSVTELAKSAAPPALVAPTLGLTAAYLERGDQALHVALARPEELPPERPITARIALLLLDGDRRPTRLVTRDVQVPADGKDKVAVWTGKELE